MFRKKKKKYEYQIFYNCKTKAGEEGKGTIKAQRGTKIKTAQDIEEIAEDIIAINGNYFEWVGITDITYLGKSKAVEDKR